MLRLILDSHDPPDIAKLARRIVPLDISPLRDWHGGIYLNEPDLRRLALGWNERVT